MFSVVEKWKRLKKDDVVIAFVLYIQIYRTGGVPAEEVSCGCKEITRACSLSKACMNKKQQNCTEKKIFHR